MSEQVIKEIEGRMQKSLQNLQMELSRVRTGRASTALVDGVKVDYYGTLTPLKQMASVSVPEARLIVIQPWDQTALQSIEKAIQKADLGLTPQNDGKIIRVPVPPLNEERRKELAKLIAKTGEECKVTVRKHRRDGNEVLKVEQKDKKITEDENKKQQEVIQKMTDKYIQKIDEMLSAKEKEIMEV